MELFLAYYGLDWLSSFLGLFGLYLVSEKRAIGFVFTALSVVLAAAVALMAAQYGFLVANTVTFVLAVRGYVKWHTPDR
jgi:nicotinamide riboside transporter PnuC